MTVLVVIAFMFVTHCYYCWIIIVTIMVINTLMFVAQKVGIVVCAIVTTALTRIITMVINSIAIITAMILSAMWHQEDCYLYSGCCCLYDCCCHYQYDSYCCSWCHYGQYERHDHHYCDYHDDCFCCCHSPERL